MALTFLLSPHLLGLGFVAAATLPPLFYLAVRYEVATIALLLGTFVVTHGVRDHYVLAYSIGGVQINALDVISVILMVVAVHRAATLGINTLSRGLALLLLLLLVVHVARGVFDFGVQTGVSQSRNMIDFVAPLVYAATNSREWDERVWRLIAVTGTVLVFIAAYYMSVEGFRSVSDAVIVSGVKTDPRPVIADSTLVILDAAILFPVLRWPSARMAGYLTALAIAGVVAMQHRTIWVAGAVIGVVSFVAWSKRRLHHAESLVFGATGLLMLSLPLAVWGFLRTTALNTSADQAIGANSTFLWRLTGWKELVVQHHTLSDVMFGMPSGASWARVVDFGTTNVSPHNFFVEAFLRFGLPGVVLLAMLLYALWRHRASYASRVGLTQTCITLIVVSQFAFSMTYALGIVQGLILGVLISGHAARHGWMRECSVAEPSRRGDAHLVAVS